MDVANLKLEKYFTIGLAERMNVQKALKSPLSGYLGGVNKAGYFVTQLQDKWRQAFGVKHAIACNSATSGLLAACMAVGIGPGDSGSRPTGPTEFIPSANPRIHPRIDWPSQSQD